MKTTNNSYMNPFIWPQRELNTRPSTSYLWGLLLCVALGSNMGLSFAQVNNPLEGQDSLVLENDRIEDVVDSEKPFIKPPYQEIKQGSQEDITFESKAYYVETNFEPAPPDIQPIELVDETPDKNNLLKLGIGRFTTPLVDLYLNNGPDNTLDASLDIHHLSAHNDIVPLRRFRENYGTLRGSYYNGDNTFAGHLSVYNSTYFYYAGDDSVLLPLDAAAREDSLRMGLLKVDIGAKAFSTFDPSAPTFYEMAGNVRLYNDRNRNREVHIDLKPSGGFRFSDEASIGADARIFYVNGTIGEVGQNRFHFNVVPQFTYLTERFQADIGFQYGFFGSSAEETDSRSNLGPDIELTYALAPGSFSIFAGYQSRMDVQTYYDMIGNNPYLAPDISIEPTVTGVNVFAGVKGNIDQSIDFSAKGYFQRRTNQLMYVSRDSIVFDAIYDSLTTVTGAHAELNYDLNDVLKLGGALSLNVYSTTNQDSITPKFFHATPIRADFFGSYTFQEKLTSRASLVVYGPTPIGIEGDEIITRNPFLNLSLGADFRPVENVSIFVEVDNLLSTNYQRWFNYPERGIDFRGGVTVAF